MINSHRAFVRGAVMAAASMLATALTPERSEAANSVEPKSATVRYHIADLDTAEGVAALYRHIRGAAAEVCSPLESRLLERERIYTECFNHAVANAVQSVHNQALSAYHWDRIRGWKRPQIEAPISLAEK